MSLGIVGSMDRNGLIMVVDRRRGLKKSNEKKERVLKRLHRWTSYVLYIMLYQT